MSGTKLRITRRLVVLREPRLEFRYGQRMLDPRDGLTLFGPWDAGRQTNFKVGMIGPSDALKRMKTWLTRMQSPISTPKPDIARPFFPGFSAAFGTSFNVDTVQPVKVSNLDIHKYLHYTDSHQRVSHLARLYADPLIQFAREEHSRVDIWFVVIPDEIYAACRPLSRVSSDGGIEVGIPQKRDRVQGGLFDTDEDRLLREAYFYDTHFHHQLKLRLIEHRIITQIVRESTIAHRDFLNKRGEPKRDLTLLEPNIAWNLATALYYKVGGLPWKLGDIRENVCYVGLVFKQDRTAQDPRTACCAAQMFLDTGDGLVFKGALGHWYNPNTNEYHLDRKNAGELLRMALESFRKKNDRIPKEIFIHGRTYLNDDEWEGFAQAVPPEINLVAIRIVDNAALKIFRLGRFPVLRASAYLATERLAFHWTRGFIPRLQTVLGLETPNPLEIRITRGRARIDRVCRDVLALTKLNYNACTYGDGLPVTLKFADAVGEILTAGPTNAADVLPFRFYI